MRMMKHTYSFYRMRMDIRDNDAIASEGRVVEEEHTSKIVKVGLEGKSTN